MKIIYSGIRAENYNPNKKFGFEYGDFYLTLKNMRGVEVIEHPFDLILEVGRKKFNEKLLSLIRDEKPDLFFAFMYTDELDKNVLDKIKELTASLAWFADDSWRFYNYSRFWAKHFSWVVTTYSWMPEFYRRAGQKNVIRSQWGVDPKTYRPVKPGGLKEARPTERYQSFGRVPEVSFVGSFNGPRGKIISALEKAGIDVKTYGSGWPSGRVGREEMTELFSLSKINLGLNPAPGYFNKNSLGRLLFRKSLNKIIPDFHLWSNLQSWFHRGVPQIKARHFQIPACGGFLMTSMADDLGSYYKIGEEIVVYKDTKDLISKINYYLANDDERRRIARAGYERTTREHTYERRFKELFDKVGLNI